MIAIEVPPSKRQLTSSLIGIFASKVTKVNRAALANAQRHASVQRFGELTGLLVNACQVSESLHWPLSRYTPATPRQGLSRGIHRGTPTQSRSPSSPNPHP